MQNGAISQENMNELLTLQQTLAEVAAMDEISPAEVQRQISVQLTSHGSVQSRGLRRPKKATPGTAPNTY